MYSMKTKNRKIDKKTVLDKVTINNETTLRLKLKALCEEHNLNPYMFQPGGYPPSRCMIFPINAVFVPLENIIHTKFLFITNVLICKWFGGSKREIAERRYGRCLAVERNVCRITVLFRELNIYILSGFQSKHSSLVVKVHIGIYDRIYAVAQAFCSCQTDELSRTASCRHVAALLYLLQDYSNTDNKILLYKAILKPIWTYGIQLWGTACNSNIAILQRFQNKVLRVIVDAPYYVTNEVIQKDITIASIKDEIYQYSIKYRERLTNHPNALANQMNECENRESRRLRRYEPADLVLGPR